MTLRDLQLKLQKSTGTSQGNVVKQVAIGNSQLAQTRLEITAINADVACNVVDHLFRYVNICLQEDKSKVKLSLFAKSFIKGILTDSVRTGINDFIRNMNDKEIRSLLDDIEKELNKRVRY